MPKKLVLETLNHAHIYECTIGLEPIPYETLHIQTFEDLHQVETQVYKHGDNKIFLDIETTGLDPFTSKLILIQILSGTKIFLINIGKLYENTLEPHSVEGILRILEDESIIKIGHNLKFDLKFLSHFFSNCSPRFKNLYDTYLAEELLNAGRNIKDSSSLKALAKKYLNIEMDKTEKTSFRDGNLTQKQLDYATNDVIVLKSIYENQSELLLKAGLIRVSQLEFSIIPAIAGIELSGMKIDLRKLKGLKEKYALHLKNLETELDELIQKLPMTGQLIMFGPRIKYNSPIQVKQTLFNLGYKVTNANTETLEKINHPFAKRLVEYRKKFKLLSSFIETLPKHIHPKTGRIHAEFFQLGTKAGRFSCKNPNLQQIPKDQEWRELFVAEQGYKIITADYSQIELRILAEYSQDPAFIEAYQRGKDLHSETAVKMFRTPILEISKGQRDIAKTINFGLCYGMGPQGLASRLNISEEEAKLFIEAYFQEYPKIKQCLEILGMNAISKLYSETLSGRKRYFDPMDSSVSRNSIERRGRNTPIQGTCGDIIKKAIQYLMDDLRGFDARITNLIHDEFVIEVKEDQVEPVKSIVEKDLILAGKDFIKSVPVEVEINVDQAWRK